MAADLVDGEMPWNAHLSHEALNLKKNIGPCLCVYTYVKHNSTYLCFSVHSVFYRNPFISSRVTPPLSESGVVAEADWQNMTDSFPGKRKKKKVVMLGTKRVVQ